MVRLCGPGSFLIAMDSEILHRYREAPGGWGVEENGAKAKLMKTQETEEER